MIFRNDDKSASVCDQIMVCKDDRRAFVAVEKDLRFHAIHAQFDGFVDIVALVGENFRDPLFYVDFVRDGRNIGGAADK